MSKRINVNPDHYKLAGRERPGDAGVKQRIPKTVNRQTADRTASRKNKTRLGR
jgi:hypothetical protein